MTIDIIGGYGSKAAGWYDETRKSTAVMDKVKREQG